VTIWTRKLDTVEQLDTTTFRMDGGVHLAKAAKVAADASLTGGEFFIGIPGTVGGAIRMNAGALGQQTSDVVTSARIWNRQTRQLETWPAEQLGFAYRHSTINPNHHIIVDATLTFTPTNEPDAVKERMKSSVHFRKTHHPIEPNGGSVFRNPLPTGHNPHPWPAGRMLDSLGAKGAVNQKSAKRDLLEHCWHVGGASISPRHANFIINTTGTATSTDVLQLMTRMQTRVAEEFGVTLRPENLFLGDATDDERTLWHRLTHQD
jgi:UDP-N-acetylmuramate dehydrogenase